MTKLRSYIVLIFMCAISTATMGQSSLFNTSFHYDQGAELLIDVQYYQNGYLAVGSSGTPSASYLLLTHSSLQGDSLLFQHYDDPNFFLSSGKAVIENQDSVLLGLTAINKTTGDYQFVVGRWVEMDSLYILGNYGDPSQDDIIKQVIPTQDRNYLLLGATQRNDALDVQMLLIKIQPDGQKLWSKEIGGVGFENVYDGLELEDDGFIFCGYKSFGSTENRIWVVRTDSSGNIRWQKYYGGPYNDFGGAITQTKDGGFAIAGYKKLGMDVFPNKAEAKAWIIKIDTGGTIEWDKKYSHPKYPRTYLWQRIIQAEDGSYVAIGNVEDSLKVDRPYLLKVDSAGELVWQRVYTRNPSKNHYVYDFEFTTDGGYILCGSTWNTTQDAWVLKLDSLGCDTPGCHTPTGIVNGPPPIEVLTLHAFPNPATDFIHIRGRWPVTKILPGSKLVGHVVNLNGQVVKTFSLMEMNPGDYLGTTATSSLSSGLYLIRIQDEGQTGALGTVKIMVK